MIVGVGIDVCDVDRFTASLDRTPGLRGRLFTPDEAARPAASLAARFAAKEALAKALGAPTGMAWHDAEVVSEASGRPRFALRGTVQDPLALAGADLRLDISGPDMGLLAPLTGVPLPFISSGSTSLITLLMSMGLLLNVASGGSAHLRAVRPGQRRSADADRDRGRRWWRWRPRTIPSPALWPGTAPGPPGV